MVEGDGSWLRYGSNGWCEMTADYLSNSVEAADPRRYYEFRIELDQMQNYQIYPNCPMCGGVGYQVGCSACQDSGIDFLWIQKMRA